MGFYKTNELEFIILSLFFQALQQSPMGNVHSIMQGAPILVMVLGHFFFNDRLNFVRGFCAISLIGGIICIAKPKDVSLLSEEVLKLTVGPWADEQNGFTWKIINVLKVRGGHGK